MNPSRTCKSTAALALLALASTHALAVTPTYSFSGNFDDPNEVQLINFSVTGAPTQVTITGLGNTGGFLQNGVYLPPDGFDTIFTLFAGDGTYIDEDDDGGPNFDSMIDLLLNPGNYILAVSAFDNGSIADLADGFDLEGDFFGAGTHWGLDMNGATFAALGIVLYDVIPEAEETVFIFHHSAPEVLELVDIGAIDSANWSAIPFALAQREIQFDAARTPIRDLNSRLFRLRSRAKTAEVLPPPVETIAMDKNGKPAEGPGKDAKKVVVMDATSAPAPVKTLGVYVGGDFSATDQDQLADVAGFDTETWSGTVGVEYSPIAALTLGLGVSYVHSDADLGYLGDSEVEGIAISPYVSYYQDGFYADALYSAGLFENEFSRKTLLGQTADGDADSVNHTVEVHAGYNIEIGKIITGPILGGEYVNGSLDGYTERNGGSANVRADEQDYESLVSELGWQVSVPLEAGSVKITPQLRASWKHQFMNDGDEVGVGLVDSPFIRVRGDDVSRHGSYQTSAETQAPGEDYASLGAGVAVGLGDWSVILDYEGEYFREDSSAHYASLRVGLKF
jgi:hypothetical protein